MIWCKQHYLTFLQIFTLFNQPLKKPLENTKTGGYAKKAFIYFIITIKCFRVVKIMLFTSFLKLSKVSFDVVAFIVSSYQPFATFSIVILAEAINLFSSSTIFFVLIIAGLFVGCGYKKTPIYQSSLDTTQVNIWWFMIIWLLEVE